MGEMNDTKPTDSLKKGKEETNVDKSKKTLYKDHQNREII